MNEWSLAIFSDVHAGSTVAPSPRLRLDDGGHYDPSESQKWLLSQWEAYWTWVSENRADGPITSICVGDLFDGDHHDTVQLASRHPGIEFAVAKALFAYPIANLDIEHFVFVRGTEAHVGKSGNKEEGFARYLAEQGHNVVIDPETGNHAWWHFRGDFGPVRLDAAHHGSIGQRAWTKYNAIMAQAADILVSHVETRDRYPDLVVRGHVHTYGDSGDAYPVRVIQLPAWQLKTGHAHRVVPNKVSDIGGILVNIDDHGYEVKKFVQRPSRGAVWQAP